MIDEDLKKYVKKVTVRDVGPNEVICNNCRIKYYRLSKNESNQTRQPLSDTQEKKPVQQTIKSPKAIKLNINTASKSHKYCFLCHKKGTFRHTLVVVPSKPQTQAFIDKGVYTEPNSLCCKRT